MVELRGIGKYFPAGGVTALEGASFELRPGEIHALLGENGAGKSTLMQILAGYLKPGAGGIFLGGEERRFAAPADALAAGIGMVRQHPGLNPGFRVWEDCVLGAEPCRGFFLDRRKARNRVRELSDRWGFGLPLDQGTETLTVSQRQKAAVLSLLLRDARWLIFDEPSAVLSPGETEGLFRLFRLLAAGGTGIVLISHKLDETLALAGRVTILRRGKTVAASLPAASLSAEAAGALMFGLAAAPSGGASRGGGDPGGALSPGGLCPRGGSVPGGLCPRRALSPAGLCPRRGSVPGPCGAGTSGGRAGAAPYPGALPGMYAREDHRDRRGPGQRP
jgi:simple sugar transport system ATP-binding protein